MNLLSCNNVRIHSWLRDTSIWIVSNLEFISRSARPCYCKLDKNDGTIKSVSEFCDDTLTSTCPGSRSIVPTMCNRCVIGENNSGKAAEIRLRFFFREFFFYVSNVNGGMEYSLDDGSFERDEW